MISDERLEDVRRARWDGIRSTELQAMAEELIKLRKAFNKHVAWMADDGSVYGPVDFEGDADEMDLVAKVGGFEPLFRKP